MNVEMFVLSTMWIIDILSIYTIYESKSEEKDKHWTGFHEFFCLTFDSFFFYANFGIFGWD